MGKMGKLAEPQTRDINGLIYEEAKSALGGNLEYYIGIEKNSGGKWVYSSSGKLLSASLWSSSQPNDDGNCVSVTGGKWFDGACSYERFSVCEF